MKKLVLALIITLLGQQAFSQSMAKFYSRNYSPSLSWDYPLAMRPTSANDTSFIVLNSCYDAANQNYNVYVAKLKANGLQEVWRTTLLSTGVSSNPYYDGKMVVTTTNEMYVALDYQGDIKVIHINASGIIQNTWTYDFGDTDFPGSINLSSDGYPIITYSTGTTGGDQTTWLMKVDGNTILWNNQIYTTNTSTPSIVKTTSDGGYIIGGTRVFVGCDFGYVVKVNSTGTVEWDYDMPIYTQVTDIQPMPNGNYIIATASTSAADLSSLDNSGTLEWSTTFEQMHPDLFVTVRDLSVVTGSPFELMISGSSGSGIAQDYLFGIVNFGLSSPIITWYKRFPGNGNNAQLDGLRIGNMLSDGTYLAVGPHFIDAFANVSGTIVFRSDATGAVQSHAIINPATGETYPFGDGDGNDGFITFNQIGDITELILTQLNADDIPIPLELGLTVFSSYFNMLTNAISTPPNVDVGFPIPAEFVGDPNILRVLHGDVDNLTWEEITAVLDLINNVMVAPGISDFSPFVVVADESNSLSETGSAASLQLYPNPAHEFVIIESKTAIQQIEVFDLKGNKVSTETKNLQAGKTAIKTRDFQAGIYYIQVTDVDHAISINKLIVE